jgi:hypothetical protein
VRRRSSANWLKAGLKILLCLATASAATIIPDVTKPGVSIKKVLGGGSSGRRQIWREVITEALRVDIPKHIGVAVLPEKTTCFQPLLLERRIVRELVGVLENNLFGTGLCRNCVTPRHLHRFFDIEFVVWNSAHSGYANMIERLNDNGWRFAYIVPNGTDCWRSFATFFLDFQLAQKDVGPLGRHGGLQLPICSSRLFFHFVKLALHDGQLALHCQELPHENCGRENTDKNQGERKETYISSPTSHHSLIGFVAFAALALASVVAAFKSAEYADDHRWPWWPLPFLGFLAVAFGCASHAI